MDNGNSRKSGRLKELGAIMIATGLMVGAYMFLRSTLAQDTWKSWWYQETPEMGAIREELELTNKGERIFKASEPALEEEVSFNRHCGEAHENVTLMGCYTDGKIYIYEVTMESLKDSNKVTAAHELLHAVWLRLSEGERKSVEAMLDTVKADNEDWAEQEVELYREEERIEELYTRAATKLRELPEELEEHYRNYFRNRLKIVEFYENYQAPFKELQAKNEEIDAQMKQLQAEIQAEREDYEMRIAKWEQEVDEFNECATKAGCFASTSAFNARRAELETERVALNMLRTEVNEKIDRNNELVFEYNENLKNLGELREAMHVKTIYVPVGEEI